MEASSFSVPQAEVPYVVVMAVASSGDEYREKYLLKLMQ
jgi:hypothetical protein